MPTIRAYRTHQCTAHIEGGELCGHESLIIETRNGGPWTVACPNGHQWIPVPGSVHTIRATTVYLED